MARGEVMMVKSFCGMATCVTVIRFSPVPTSLTTHDPAQRLALLQLSNDTAAPCQ